MSDSAKATPSSGFTWIFLGVATYIVASFWVTVSMNDKFLKISEDSRVAWRKKLYGFLDQDDYVSLAETPVVDARAAYERTKTVSCGVVVVVTGLLLFGALSEAGAVATVLDTMWRCGRLLAYVL